MPFSIDNYLNLNTGNIDHPNSVPCHNSVGPYTVRLAETAQEINQCLELRQRVFFNHLDDYTPPDEEIDYYAHHLIVLETDQNGHEKVVGNLRLVNSKYKPDHIQYYTEDYYDITPLKSSYETKVELGRFCVDEGLRSGKILMLLWKAAIEYLKYYDIDLMFGISSFPEMNVEKHRTTLQYLHQHNSLRSELMTKPILNTAKNITDLAAVDNLKDFKIPTLMKGYLKMGGRISDTYYEDPIFNTLFVMLAVEKEDFKQYIAST